ncbi:MAG: (Fe-S)-binding protein [Desulfurivibrio sp.]|nr:(Fe-S)-binding protein [Desulfurivibrio sp.]
MSDGGPSQLPACAKCGACSTVCPVYRVSGREYHTGRGKLHLLSRLEPGDASATMAEILSHCLLCGACSAVCSRGIPVAEQLAAARAELTRRAGCHPLWRRLTSGALSHPRLLSTLAPLARRLAGQHIPASSGLPLRLGVTTAVPELPPPAAAADNEQPAAAQPTQAWLFSGCYTAYLDPAGKQAITTLLDPADQGSVAIAADWHCCGLAAYSGGQLDQARELARRNIAAHAGTAPIIVGCASCAAHLSRYPQLLADDPQWYPRARDFAARLNEFSQYLADRLPATPAGANQEERETASRAAPLRVLYHDPCHLRFHLPTTAPPRQLLAATGGVELVELPGGPRCCGHGGLFQLAHPETAAAILDELAAAFRQSTAEVVTSTCSGCLLQWQRAQNQGLHNGRVVHLATLLAWLSAGHNKPATTCGF